MAYSTPQVTIDLAEYQELLTENKEKDEKIQKARSLEYTLRNFINAGIIDKDGGVNEKRLYELNEYVNKYGFTVEVIKTGDYSYVEIYPTK